MDWPIIGNWRDLPTNAKGAQPSLERVRDVALALQKISLTKQVKEEISALRRDILGHYMFPPGASPWIEIYWMPMALVSAILDVKIEDLAAVTLAHEPVHGYTHLARDIDGINWKTNDFAQSDREVVEGLAQFYTELVSEKLSSRFLGMQLAFERFLDLQSPPYKIHKSWMKNITHQLRETFRFSMITARSRGRIECQQWEALLSETSKRLQYGVSPNKEGSSLKGIKTAHHPGENDGEND